jgi:hypothetical protein
MLLLFARGLSKSNRGKILRNERVNMLEQMHFVDERPASYATAADFCKTFTEEMHSLYLLSLLLTADHDKAEQSFISAMEECVDGTGVRMEWKRSWARRVVLKQAIQMVRPAPEYADSLSFISLETPATLAEDNPFAAILSLDAFERFIFVMSILEGQSDEECAILLRCSPRDVMMARVLALKRITRTGAQAEEVLQS